MVFHKNSARSEIAKDTLQKNTHMTGGEKLLDVVLGGALGFSFSLQADHRDLRPPPTVLVMVRPFPPLNTNFGLQLERRVRETATVHVCSLP